MPTTPENNRYTFTNTNNLNGAHLGFTSGLQGDLNTLIQNGGAVEGTFYLTTDTHRLYIGRTVTADSQATGTYTTKTIPIPVNEGIQNVASVSDLPQDANAGEFYYITNDNILCIYSGSTNNWVQINPNTNTNTSVTSTSVTSATIYQQTQDLAVVDGKTYYEQSGTDYVAVANPVVANISTYYEPTSIRYTLTVNQTKHDETKGNDHTGDQSVAAVTTTFDINSSDIANVLSVSAGLARTTASNNSSTLSVDGGVSNGHTVTLKGSENVTISTSSTDEIVVSTPGYALAVGTPSTSAGSIKLRKGNNDQSTINITAGNHLSIDTTDTTGITINHDAPGAATQTNNVDDQYGEVGTDHAATKILNGSTASTIKIPTFKKDAYGHITAVDETEVTLSGIKDASVDNSGHVVLTGQNNQTVVTGTTQSVFHKITVDGTENTVYNQGSLGTFYSAAGVDAKITEALQGANAMVYRGVVGTTDGGGVLTLPTENVQIGDTYLVSGVSSSGGSIYTKTLDTAIVSGKDYYTLSGGSFTKVNSPVANDLNSYYEEAHDVENGDLFIATGSESSGVIQGAVTWTYVPSGDDIDTHYTLTNSSNQITLRNTTNNTDVKTIQFVSGTKITPKNISVNSETGFIEVGFNHDSSSVTAGTYGAAQTGTASNFETDNKFSVPSLTVDASGHITSASTKTYTLPQATVYKLKNTPNSNGTGTADTVIRLFAGNDSSAGGTITLAGDSSGGVSVAANSSTIEIKHTALSTAAANNNNLSDYTSNASLTSFTTDGSGNDTLSALTALNIDGYGHVSEYKVTNFKLPSYSLNMGNASNDQFTIKLRKGNNDVSNSAFTVRSDNLKITNSGSTYTVNLEWGSFTANPST